MGMKLTYINLPEGTWSIRGVGRNRNREFFLGMGCENAWGGGFVSSMELIDGSTNLVRIRKDRPFVGPPDPNKGNKQETFTSVVVSVAQYIPVEDEASDPPAAKPVQQQSGNQQRR